MAHLAMREGILLRLVLFLQTLCTRIRQFCLTKILENDKFAAIGKDSLENLRVLSQLILTVFTRGNLITLVSISDLLIYLQFSQKMLQLLSQKIPYCRKMQS